MSLFLSTYLNKVDKKGRLSIPARYRSVLQEGGGVERLIIFQSLTHNALEACSVGFIEKFWNRLQGMAPFTTEQEDLLWSVLADSHELAIDGNGRVIMPKKLLTFAGIEDAALLVGQGDRFQIWNPEAASVFREAVQGRIGKKFAKGESVWSAGKVK